MANIYDRAEWEVALHIPSKINDGPRGSGSTRLELNFVRVDKEGHIRNLSDATFENPHAGFADLRIMAQWDENNPEKNTYAWDVEYRSPYATDLARAEVMVKTLRKVEKVKTSFPVDAQSFGQFVTLLLQGLKVTKIVTDGKNASNGWSWDDSEHFIHDTKYVGSTVDGLIFKHRNPTKVEVM